MEDGGLIMTTKADNAREAPMIDQNYVAVPVRVALSHSEVNKAHTI